MVDMYNKTYLFRGKVVTNLVETDDYIVAINILDKTKVFAKKYNFMLYSILLNREDSKRVQMIKTFDELEEFEKSVRVVSKLKSYYSVA